MQPYKTLFFYSKYSEKSRRALEVLQDVEYIEKVCIDTENVRNKITTASNIQITVVPTLLVFYSDGTLEKMDNQTFNMWLQEMIRQNVVVDERIEGTGRSSIDIRSQYEGYGNTRSDIMRRGTTSGGVDTEDTIKNENGQIPIKNEPFTSDIKKVAEELARQRDSMPGLSS